MFSSTSFAEWTKVSEDTKGNTYYVDFERIRKYDGYIHFWQLGNFLKSKENGTWSNTIYFKGDCRKNKLRVITVFEHNSPMGKEGGVLSSETTSLPWFQIPPNSTMEDVLKKVCSR